MAEKRNYPDHSEESHAPRREPGDPLAELARLIGQNDPFADGGQPKRPSLDSVRSTDRPTPEWLARPVAPPESDYDPHPAQQNTYTHAQHDAGYDVQQHQAHDGSHADHQHEEGGDERYRVARPAPAEYEDAFYAEDGHMPPHGEEGYAPRRRGGLITIAAVLGLAVIGTAGAFGYRAFTSPSATSDNPPIIKADTTPPKSFPVAAAPSANSDAPVKPYQERIGAPGSERVVPREEQPLSLPTARPNAPLPQSAFAPVPGTSTPNAMVAPPASSNANEPKRVRTMTIRQDATGAPDVQPTAAQPAARMPAAKQSSATPMTIAPSAEPSSRSKVAARTPPAQAAGGAYVVQVSAQKTEDEAQSSYRALQQKYPAVLAGREANIRRADLGDKGVYYRAQVGPFGTSEQANSFCSSLKDAGGQCIVQKN